LVHQERVSVSFEGDSREGSKGRGAGGGGPRGYQRVGQVEELKQRRKKRRISFCATKMQEQHVKISTAPKFSIQHISALNLWINKMRFKLKYRYSYTH